MGDVLSVLFAVACVFVFVVVAMASANSEEPLFMSKADVLQRVNCGACPLSKHWVVKPCFGAHGGKGVNLESQTWTLKDCERLMQGPCIRQPFHPGPFEGRAVRAGQVWEPTIVWKVPCEDCTDPERVNLTLPFETQLHACIENAFPTSPFLAVDFRTDGSTFCVLEVNGAFGFTLQWTQHANFGLWVLQWIAQRTLAGLQHPERFPHAFVHVCQTVWRKWITRHVPSRVWF